MVAAFAVRIFSLALESIFGIMKIVIFCAGYWEKGCAIIFAR